MTWTSCPWSVAGVWTWRARALLRRSGRSQPASYHYHCHSFSVDWVATWIDTTKRRGLGWRNAASGSPKCPLPNYCSSYPRPTRPQPPRPGQRFSFCVLSVCHCLTSSVVFLCCCCCSTETKRIINKHQNSLEHLI